MDVTIKLMPAPDIVWFSDVDKNDVNLVGGKGANLGELAKFDIPIPNGFIVTSQAYFKNLIVSGALDRIRGILYGLDVENPALLQAKAEQAQQEIKKIEIDPDLQKNLYAHYRKLGKNNPAVAVRSSATAEDLPEASFAGQQATFLNVHGEKNLKDALLGAWASLFEARAIYYRVQQKFDHFKVGIAIPVQLMVESETSGVMFTLDPVTNDKKKIIVESVFGLGELIVSGSATPDHYEVAKKDFSISSKKVVTQESQLVKSTNGNKLVKIAKAYRKSQKLPDEKIIELARIGYKIEKHYFFPQDIEWAYEAGKLYIVQTRPITTIKKISEDKENLAESAFSGMRLLLQGAPASPVIGTGRVSIIKNATELDKVKKGDVLVTEMTNPDFVPAMKRAIAIVTDRGGRTSHAAIVSRELGIACVVGTEKATRVLKNGEVVTVDGSKGTVYQGQLKHAKNLDFRENTKSFSKKTATHVYVNIAEPQLAREVAAKNVDGIGLLRAEFILAQIGKHPKEFILEKKRDEFIERLASDISIFGKAFGNRPVIYRATDFKSNEYRNLKGGDKYEPKESNPMLGYRGAFRYIRDPDVFKMELEALMRVREKHKNVELMIPFVRTVSELQAVRGIVEEMGLFADHTFNFYMMVEIPANVILLEEFIKVGIDGISIGSNDLTMLILGTDRDNEEVAGEFNELNPAVLWALEKTVRTAAHAKIKASICGQAPSVFPDLCEKLVSWGINSISVNPDSVDVTREHIYEAEKKLIKSK